jgi:hypothetical protein
VTVVKFGKARPKRRRLSLIGPRFVEEFYPSGKPDVTGVTDSLTPSLRLLALSAEEASMAVEWGTL